MASRLLQKWYGGLVRPLVSSHLRFSTGAPSTKKSGDSNNDTAMTVLKIVGGFLPGVYIGHVLSDKGMLENESEDKPDGGKDEDKDKKDKKKDKKDKV